MYYTQHQQIGLTNRPTHSLLCCLDDLLLDTNNRIKLLPAAAYQASARQELRIWMHHRNRYCIPTVELVDWLKAKIDGRSAIEIAAGNDDLAYHLGIRSISNQHAISTAYTTVLFPGQIPTRVITSDVHHMDVTQAIYELRPEVAIGAWIPDKFTDNYRGLDYAPNDYQIIQNADYIHIGTEKIHGKCRILGFPHEAFKPQGLVSRTSESPPDDVIHVWKKLA
ncbi:hypothetical protein QT972_31505 [Microcoleus sp. herbarium7]|uniref:hypothetical protein n=1 Tax=Microcoleus sp. herbarium7 TaxID=3055435 RepID=UPI002FD0778D